MNYPKTGNAKAETLEKASNYSFDEGGGCKECDRHEGYEDSEKGRVVSNDNHLAQYVPLECIADAEYTKEAYRQHFRI